MNKEENSIILEIKNEYEKINKKWFKLHYHTFIGLVIFAFVFESITAVAFYTLDNIEMAFITYVVKYIISPLIVNICFIFVGVWVIKFSGFKQKTKVYFISLLFVGVCFVFFTVHIIFNSLYPIFFVPIFLTIIYADVKLTTVTAIVSIAAKTISELFITWDPKRTYPFENDIGFTNFILSTFILLMFYFISLIIIRFEKEKSLASIQKENEHYDVKQKLIIDELTNLYNRRALRNAFQDIEDDSYDSKYVYIMIDFDNFKALNDTLGHQYGDKCLNEFGNILEKNCLDGSTPFRYGGDEFCILTKNVEIDNTLNMCKNIQYDLKKYMISESINVNLAVSIGIAYHKEGMSASQLVKNADLAMYRSKESNSSISIWDESFEN